MDIIFEPPELFAPVERWEEWLATLRTMPPEAEGLAEEIAAAEKWIPRRIAFGLELEQLQQAQKGARAT